MSLEKQLDEMLLVTARNHEGDVQELFEKIFSFLEKKKDFIDTKGGDQEVLDTMFSFLASESRGGVENLLNKMITWHIKKSGGDENAKKLVLSIFDDYQKIAIDRINTEKEKLDEKTCAEIPEKTSLTEVTKTTSRSILLEKIESAEVEEDGSVKKDQLKPIIGNGANEQTKIEKRKAKKARQAERKKKMKEEQLKLIEACTHDDVATVKKLLAAGHNVNETSKEGHTLLIVACDAGSSQVVQLLLEMNASVEDRGIDGDFTPLIVASSRGHIDVVNLLLQRGALVDAQSLSTSSTSLIYAVAGQHKEVVKALLQNGADVTASNTKGHTPTLIAKHYKLNDIIKILSEHSKITSTNSHIK